MKRLACLSVLLTLTACSHTTVIPIPEIPASIEMRTIGIPSPTNSPSHVYSTIAIPMEHSGKTAYAGTLAAKLIQTMTPTPSNGGTTCRPGNLKARYAGSNAGDTTLFLGVEVKNISDTSCLLQVWPELELVNIDGKHLNVIHGYYVEPVDPTDYVPLDPGQKGGFLLQWGNWCQPPVPFGVIIRVTLPNEGGTIDAPTNGTDPINGTIYKGGKCVDPGAKSFVLISKFEYGPVVLQP